MADALSNVRAAATPAMADALANVRAAATPDDLNAAFEALEVAIQAGAIVLSREALLATGREKRDAPGNLWSRDLARVFGRVLRLVAGAEKAPRGGTMRLSVLHLECGVCGARLFEGLRHGEYDIGAPSQPHLTAEFYTDASPLPSLMDVSGEGDGDETKFNCPANCHPGLWLVDAGTGAIERRGHRYAAACGDAFCRIKYEEVELPWDALGTWKVVAREEGRPDFTYSISVTRYPVGGRSGGDGGEGKDGGGGAGGGGGGGGGSGGAGGGGAGDTTLLAQVVGFDPQNGFPAMCCPPRPLTPIAGEPHHYEGSIEWQGLGDDPVIYGTSTFRLQLLHKDERLEQHSNVVDVCAAAGVGSFVQGTVWDEEAVLGSLELQRSLCVRL